MTTISIALLLLGVGQTAPAPLPFDARLPQRVAVAARLEPAPRANQPATLVIEAEPQPGIHVYAPGNPSYIAVTVHVDAKEGIDAGEPVFPAGEPYVFGELKEIVQVYSRAFTIRQPVTLAGSARKAGPIVITGHVRYQACDDRICFPPATAPFTATAHPRAVRPPTAPRSE